MTNHSEHEDDVDEEDPRVQLLESLANGLATLSEASDTPQRHYPSVFDVQQRRRRLRFRRMDEPNR